MHIYIYIHIIRSPRLTGQAMQWRDALRVGHHPFAARGDVTRNPGWALGAVALRRGMVRFVESFLSLSLSPSSAAPLGAIRGNRHAMQRSAIAHSAATRQPRTATPVRSPPEARPHTAD